MGYRLNGGYHPSRDHMPVQVRIIVGILLTVLVLVISARLNAASEYARRQSCESISYQKGDC